MRSKSKFDIKAILAGAVLFYVISQVISSILLRIYSYPSSHPPKLLILFALFSSALFSGYIIARVVETRKIGHVFLSAAASQGFEIMLGFLAALVNSPAISFALPIQELIYQSGVAVTPFIGFLAGGILQSFLSKRKISKSP